MNILLAITGDTWMITGLGFGLVLVLLCVFVYIMKLLGFIMQPRTKAVNAQHDNTVAHTQKQNKETMTMTGQATAAIAMALHLYYNGIHDDEPIHITIHNHTTQWNSKAYGMNQ